MPRALLSAPDKVLRFQKAFVKVLHQTLVKNATDRIWWAASLGIPAMEEIEENMF